MTEPLVYDPSNEAIRTNPFPFYEALQERDPVHWSPAIKSWIITRYDDVRQVAMYVCHVAYSMPMGEVAEAFGRDRTTVGHACRMVEDRRDDRAYDTFVAIVERMASAVHLLVPRTAA